MTVPSHDTGEVWGKKDKKKKRKDNVDVSQAASPQVTSTTDSPPKSGKKRKGDSKGDTIQTHKKSKDSVEMSEGTRSEPSPQKATEQTSHKKKTNLKKKKKKKQMQKKKKKDEDSEEEEEEAESSEKKEETKSQKVAPQENMKLALDYLRLWENDRSSWRFQKIRQVWLLQNMYNSKKVPDKEFDILLRYLEKLEGKAKVLTIQKSEELMETLTAEMEKKENQEDEGDKEDEETKSKRYYEVKKMKKQWKRAKQILQILS